MGERRIAIRGAAQNNLRDVDVDIGPGITAVVGVSGSGKSSLAFDTVYHEAYRRFLETLSMGSPGARQRPAALRSIDGLGPAVAIAQNVLNRNPNSTVATALGVHPFLRLMFSKFADVACPACATPVRAMSDEERVHEAQRVGGPVTVPLVRGTSGSHRRLLALLREEFGQSAITVDGRPWTGRALDATRSHDITVTTGTIPPAASAADVREELARADALGSAEVRVADSPLLRAPMCPECGDWVPPLPPTAFRPEADVDTSSHMIGGRTLDALLSVPVGEVAAALGGSDVGRGPRRLVDEVRRRIDPVVALGLDHLTLDRSMPTLSRGESQRVRLAVVLAGRLEDLLHVLDEPSVGLHRRDIDALFKALGKLPGPVVMVEHDAGAVANADDVIELGPGAGPRGGNLVFQGTPAKLWEADTVSGQFFSGRERSVIEDARAVDSAPDEWLVVRGARARNLAAVDCEFPVGRLTAITGPSGAGKTTLVRDVVLASAEAGSAQGCDSFDGAVLRALAVDQSPLGNNPRSNPATYTKVFDRIRTLFAKATGHSASEFTFNRPEGACATCEGMGAIEVGLRYVASTWIDCEACEGARYRPEVLALTPEFGGRELSIADALALTVDDARVTFAADRTVARILDALATVGLGYLELGQPSPTLSGGEAQRVRLARELARTKLGDLVVLDEPTTGLHPADLNRLMSVLRGLTATGCTVIVVEHQPDLIAAADWIVELGPGGGPNGGRLVHCGPPKRTRGRAPKPRSAPRTRPRASDAITIKGATANNLRNINVEIPKGTFTAVVGVSGSGKSSLVRDILEAEASRRLLECLSMYERQGLREGPEAPVRSVEGLGPTMVLGADRRTSGGFQGFYGRRATVGSASGLDRLLALALSRTDERSCLACGGPVDRISPAADAAGRCRDCGTAAVSIQPRQLNPIAYGSGCVGCSGMGIIRSGDVDRLIVKPDAPICKGAMHSPGYFPRGYLCTPGTGGHAMVQALAAKHGFDPATTPWQDMTEQARQAFLWGDRIVVTRGHQRQHEVRWRGVMTELTAWDQGGLYTRVATCTRCEGKRLRPEYLAVTIGGRDRGDLFSMPIAELESVLDAANLSDELGAEALADAQAGAHFLGRVGLGYLHLDRQASSLSAGEAQRVRLASVLGGGLLGMTILLDEPTRGLHPREVIALGEALVQLRESGNTVVTVEHDPTLVKLADHLIEIGPGAGARGGRVVYAGPARAAPHRRDDVAPRGVAERREPTAWFEVRGARENNLTIDSVRIPLGVLAGVCGVSGSGKSTLLVDTVGLALAPPKLTTSVANSRYEPGVHDAVVDAPPRTVVCDQSRAGITSPGMHLALTPALRKAFAASDEAVAAGLTEADFSASCDACSGGQVVESMGFLPSVARECEACDGTGYRAEIRSISARGRSLHETEGLTLDELAAVWGDVPAIGRACDAARRLGVGYLTVRQPAWTLSGGEAQRVKLARELAKKTTKPTLYLLDEPTVGLHASDVEVLARALDEVVRAGHSVIVIEHDPQLLARCDWLIELGPGGGPEGGRVVAEGSPEVIAAGESATAPFLRDVVAV